MVNGWEEWENDEMDFTYDGSSNTTSLVSIGHDEIADGGTN